ncbi:MAG: hypothetical protein ACOH5I_26360 [Oligoflexus sp.]
MNRTKLILAACLMTGCAHVKDNQSFYASVGGASLGYGVGTMVDGQNDRADKNTKATQYLWALGGALTGAALDSFVFKRKPKADQTEIERAKAEANKFRELNKNFATANEEDLYLPPSRYEQRCAGEDLLAICSSENGSYTDCSEKADFFYLTPKFAVKILGFFSPKGCFPGPYLQDQKFRSIFDYEIKQLERMSK